MVGPTVSIWVFPDQNSIFRLKRFAVGCVAQHLRWRCESRGHAALGLKLECCCCLSLINHDFPNFFQSNRGSQFCGREQSSSNCSLVPPMKSNSDAKCSCCQEIPYNQTDENDNHRDRPPDFSCFVNTEFHAAPSAFFDPGRFGQKFWLTQRWQSIAKNMKVRLQVIAVNILTTTPSAKVRAKPRTKPAPARTGAAQAITGDVAV